MTQPSGTWYNQLGSIMILTADDHGGLSGTYESKVGSAHGPYILTGRFNTSPQNEKGVSVGWVVTFQNDNLNAYSTATWSGQYFGGDDDNGMIVTHWLLTSGTTPPNIWAATRVGQDTFTRARPNAFDIEKAQLLTVGFPGPEAILATM